MPNNKGFFSGASDALKMAVPLVIQKRRMDAVENRFQRTMDQHKADLLDSSIQAHDKIQAKLYSDMLGKAIDTGDEDLATNIMGSLQSSGFSGFDIPKELSGKPDKLTGEALLLQRSQKGDQEATNILKSMQERKLELTKAGTEGKIAGLTGKTDLDGIAKAIIEGRETIENIPNPFGIPMRAMVRKKVLAIDPNFNFLLPRSAFKALSSSLRNQEKQRGMMGSFVGNLEKQIDRIEEMGKDLTRFDPRIINIPIRNWKTRIAGSGHEKAFEAYMIEISNEIAKLSTGSQASIRELSTEAQARWSKIHDPNLSLKDLKIILGETKRMARMRLESTNDEIKFTKSRIGNLMGESPTRPKETSSAMQLDADALIKKYGGK